MEPKEFDNIVNEALEEESKKIIEEQLDKLDKLTDAIKNMQSLSGMSNKIQNIEPMGSGVKVIIQGISPEELVRCCGGESLGGAQTNLMQGIHHDLDECGMGGSHDIDINTEGDDKSLGLIIKIMPNEDELSIENETDMDEQTDNGELTNTFGQSLYEDPKDTNPTTDKKKDMILGDEAEVDEQEQTAVGAMAAEEDVAEEINENRSTKKVIRLTESEMETLIEKIITEARVESPSANVVPGGVPGLDVTKKAQDDSGKENDEALKAVEKKIKDFLSFEGNDDPEFPNPIGRGDQKVATKNTDSEDEVVELNRGRNPADLTYDQEPSDQFKERAKLSLVGASEMGNSQEYANAIPSKNGENIAKAAEKRKKARVNEPIYDKEAVPVDEEPNKKDRPGPESGNAGKAVASEILRMKQVAEYKKSTQ